MPDTPETKIKKYLAREIKRFAEAMDMRHSLIANPANTMSGTGRTDYDLVLLNIFYFHIEVKANENDKRDPAQKVFMMEERNGYNQVLLGSKGGVDDFIEQLAFTIPHTAAKTMQVAQEFMSTYPDGFSRYKAAKGRNESAAAKRPKRQSSKLH